MLLLLPSLLNVEGVVFRPALVVVLVVVFSLPLVVSAVVHFKVVVACFDSQDVLGISPQQGNGFNPNGRVQC